MIKILYIFFIILVTTSCNIKPVDNYHGVAFLEEKQKELLINKSNKNDIIKILGSPSTESILEDDLNKSEIDHETSFVLEPPVSETPDFDEDSVL